MAVRGTVSLPSTQNRREVKKEGKLDLLHVNIQIQLCSLSLCPSYQHEARLEDLSFLSFFLFFLNTVSELSSPRWPWTQRATCVCLLRFLLQGMRTYLVKTVLEGFQPLINTENQSYTNTLHPSLLGLHIFQKAINKTVSSCSLCSRLSSKAIRSS